MNARFKAWINKAPTIFMTKTLSPYPTISVILIFFFLLASCSDKNDPEEPTQFRVGQTELSFPSYRSENSISVESQTAPAASSDAAWLHLYDAVRNGVSENSWTIKVTADANAAAEQRTATVTVVAGDRQAVVNVTQSGAAPVPPADIEDPDEANYTLPAIAYPTDDNIGETAQQAVRNIFAGWNIGNSLEVPDGETAWGNPEVSRELIDGVKSAGFNAVRIPGAWGSHLVADAAPYTIDSAWLSRVHEVVDYAYGNGMYVIINTHWDGGWLELHANAADCEAVVKKEKAIWTQIADEFADYGQRLIFAGNNEIRNKVGANENWGIPSADERRALEAYNQAFVDAVRATGGNNALRNLVVQSWCCNPWRALDALTMPSDPADSHLLAEVHFYDPMDFTHTDKKLKYWGYRKGYHTADNINQEDYIDNLFGMLKAGLVDKGYPVILGEYGTVCHSVSDKRIKSSERYYLEYVTKAVKDNGLAPFYWDNGQPQKGTFGIFNRHSGSVAVPHMLHGILQGACEGNYPR